MGVKEWLGFEAGAGGPTEGVGLDDYLENMGVHDGDLLDEDKYTYIKSFNCDSPQIIMDVERELKKNNIVILNVANLMHSNRPMLKKIVDDLRKLESKMYGDLGRISEDKLMVVPRDFRILKKRS